MELATTAQRPGEGGSVSRRSWILSEGALWLPTWVLPKVGLARRPDVGGGRARLQPAAFFFFRRRCLGGHLARPSPSCAHPNPRSALPGGSGARGAHGV